MGLTNNGIKMMQSFFGRIANSNCRLKNWAGNEVSVPNNTTSTTTNIAISASNSNTAAIVLAAGVGTNPESKEDYNITINPDLKFTTINTTYSLNGNTSFTLTLKNNSSEDITCTEFGYIWQLANSPYTTNGILMYRKVLSNPITVPAGDAIPVIWTIDLQNLDA